MRQDKLNNIIRPAVEAVGYELVGSEYIPQGKYTVLRIYIDSDTGVKLDDCQKVSSQVSAVLDVEDPIHGQYRLEVSSPGLDRPLFTLEHFQRFIGQAAKIRLRAPQEGRRNFNGTLKSIEDDIVVIQVDEEEFRLSWVNIEKANLIPNI